MLTRLLRHFRRSEDGNVMIEALFVLPMLFWAAFGLFTFWDAHRQINLAQKGAYGVADMLSRRQLPVDCAYLNGVHALMDYTIPGTQRSKLRITSVVWSQARNQFEVQWSRSPGNGMPRLTTASLQASRDHIPQMWDGDTVILVETEIGYEPVFDVGLDSLRIRQFVVTRPRLAPRVENSCA